MAMKINVEKKYFSTQIDSYIDEAQMKLMETIQGIINIEAIQQAQFKQLKKRKSKDLEQQIEITKNNLKINLENKDYFENKIKFWQGIKDCKDESVELHLDITL